jgi:hypothetical protein
MCTEDANEYSDTDDAINSSGPSLEVDVSTPTWLLCHLLAGLVVGVYANAHRFGAQSDDRDSALGDNQSKYVVSMPKGAGFVDSHFLW